MKITPPVLSYWGKNVIKYITMAAENTNDEQQKRPCVFTQSLVDFVIFGADDGIRTRNIQLGKLTLYR